MLVCSYLCTLGWIIKTDHLCGKSQCNFYSENILSMTFASQRGRHFFTQTPNFMLFSKISAILYLFTNTLIWSLTVIWTLFVNILSNNFRDEICDLVNFNLHTEKIYSCLNDFLRRTIFVVASQTN